MEEETYLVFKRSLKKWIEELPETYDSKQLEKALYQFPFYFFRESLFQKEPLLGILIERVSFEEFVDLASQYFTKKLKEKFKDYREKPMSEVLKEVLKC